MTNHNDNRNNSNSHGSPKPYPGPGPTLAHACSHFTGEELGGSETLSSSPRVTLLVTSRAGTPTLLCPAQNPEPLATPEITHVPSSCQGPHKDPDWLIFRISSKVGSDGLRTEEKEKETQVRPTRRYSSGSGCRGRHWRRREEGLGGGGVQAGREKQEEHPFRKGRTICSLNPLQGLCLCFPLRGLPAHPHLPFCFSSYFNPRQPNNSAVKRLWRLPPLPPHLPLGSVFLHLEPPPPRPPPCPVLLLLPQLRRLLPPAALITSLLCSKAFKGRPLPTGSSPSSLYWCSRPFLAWLPPPALPPFCLPTGFSP